VLKRSFFRVPRRTRGRAIDRGTVRSGMRLLLSAEQRIRGGHMVVDYDVNCVRHYGFDFAPHPVFVHSQKSSVYVCAERVCASA
jgi:hypothetical protein